MESDEALNPHPEGESDKARAAGRKTAVVVIHGMGEQRPMETLWGFVQAAWIYDKKLGGRSQNQIFSKPDRITGSFELRRITTRRWKGPNSSPVDFFEFYWAHLMIGNTITSVTSWLMTLLFRRPSSVPPKLRGAWVLLLIVVATLAVITALSALPDALHPDWVPHWVWPWSLALGIVVGFVQTLWVAPVAGDAARYLSPTPQNVAARQTIREAGVDLLAKLHQSGDYDRIIVVGHSLGSVIGYDIINCAWARLDAKQFWTTHTEKSASMEALAKLERAGHALVEAHSDIVSSRSAYRSAQRAYFETLKTCDADTRPIWIVSDFVSLGSPLSKADILLARDKAQFKERKALREVVSCPPRFENLNPPRFSYPLQDQMRAPHHAAAFAPTVWTNIYFDSAFVFFGDIIAGPIAPLFGSGVLDVKLDVGAPRFRHLDYWKDPSLDPAMPWISALRRAINLRGSPEEDLWANQVGEDGVSAKTRH